MKLYVGNLPFSVSEDGLKELFSSYGPTEVVLIKNSFSGKSKGFGFVVIEAEEIAKKAMEEMNGKEVEGRALKVAEAQPMTEKPRRNFNRRRGFAGRRPFKRRSFN